MNQYKLLRKSVLFLGAVCILFSGCWKKSDVSAATDHWLTDFDKASQTAQEEGKDLLINFAGSDWCYWCQRLDKEVFSKAVFWREAGKQFVLVLLDFPNDKSHQSDETQERNEQLAKQFGVQGFPTVFLADANGRSYARTGYMEGGTQAYLEHLRDLRSQKTRP